MTMGHLVECIMGKKIVSADREKNEMLRRFMWFRIKMFEHTTTNDNKIIEIDRETFKDAYTSQLREVYEFYIGVLKSDDEFEIVESVEEEVSERVIRSYDADVCYMYYRRRVDVRYVPQHTIDDLYERMGIHRKYGPDRADATPFQPISKKEIKRVFGDDLSDPTLVEFIKKELKDLGYEPHGHQVMYDGMTGKMMDGLIFYGPTYYQRLKHLVDGKIHARAQGPNQPLTRQPQEGRARDGGLRCGEMERDCLTANGATFNLRERLMEQSDRFRTFVCKYCGLIAINNPVAGIKECRVCNVSGSENIKEILLPYACKLIKQELEGINEPFRILVTSFKT